MAQENLTLGAIYPDDMWIDYDINRMLDEFRKFLPCHVPMVIGADACTDGGWRA